MEIEEEILEKYGHYFTISFFESFTKGEDLRKWIDEEGPVDIRDKYKLTEQILLGFTKLRLKEIGLEDLIPNLYLTGEFPEMIISPELSLEHRRKLVQEFEVPFPALFGDSTGLVTIHPCLMFIIKKD